MRAANKPKWENDIKWKCAQAGSQERVSRPPSPLVAPVHGPPPLKVGNPCFLDMETTPQGWHNGTLLYYISLFSGYGWKSINQCRDPMNNNKDCRVGQLTRAHGEHGDVFLFSNLGALWFSENLIRYSLHVSFREVKNNLFSFKHSYLRHFSWRF